MVNRKKKQKKEEKMVNMINFMCFLKQLTIFQKKTIQRKEDKDQLQGGKNGSLRK